MSNRSDFYPNPGSYDDLLKRMTQRVQQNKVDDQILEILQQVFEKEFSKESLALSRPERIRLFQQVTKVILNDVLKKTGDT
jgi:hypothetical protein